MENIPQPIPVNRLQQMLSGAKQIMNKVETGDYTTGNVDSRALTESGVNEMMAEGIKRPQNGYMPQNNGYSAQPVNYHTSKMPSVIKEAMLNSPQAPIMNPNYTFELSDVPDLVEKPNVAAQYRQPVRQQVVENYQPQQYYPPQQPQIPAGMMLVNEAQLQDMMKKYMLDFMTENFTKTLSESVIKKTIGTLINEGKITVKKKV